MQVCTLQGRLHVLAHRQHTQLCSGPSCATSAHRCATRMRNIAVRSSPDEDNISETLKADLERMRMKQGVSPSSSTDASTPSSSDQDKADQSPFSSFKEAVDKVLIADFFLVLMALAWLGVGVLQAKLSDSGSSQLLDIWFPLWPTLWQSAIGLLMAGALVSGGLGWLSSRGQESK